jgi:hypothetical protein
MPITIQIKRYRMRNSYAFAKNSKGANLALNFAPSGRWTLRDKAAHRR